MCHLKWDHETSQGMIAAIKCGENGSQLLHQNLPHSSDLSLVPVSGRGAAAWAWRNKHHFLCHIFQLFWEGSKVFPGQSRGIWLLCILRLGPTSTGLTAQALCWHRAVWPNSSSILGTQRPGVSFRPGWCCRLDVSRPNHLDCLVSMWKNSTTSSLSQNWNSHPIFKRQPSYPAKKIILTPCVCDLVLCTQ